jgi:proline iminopeptidase
MIEPYERGHLAVGDGHELYWECCGDPAGPPIVLLHGGPGSGCSPGSRQWFDPSWRAVLFDQRGCGRSRPADPMGDLSTQTMTALLADLEALRRHLGIERWVVFGLSWGTTLGLAYAEAHPERVSGLVLALVCSTSRDDVLWATEDVGRLFPREHERFTAAIPPSLRHLPVVDAYAAWLDHPDPAERDAAARAWCDWEDAHVALTPGHKPSPLFLDPAFRLRFARLVTHYWRHGAFLADDQLVRDAPRLDGIPGVLIHGRLDVSSPLAFPWRLSRRWTTGRLEILDDAGHGGGGFGEVVKRALRQVVVDPPPVAP